MRRILAVAILAVMLTGCAATTPTAATTPAGISDATLSAVANDLVKVAATVQAAQNSIIAAQGQGLLTVAQATALLRITNSVTAGNSQASSIVRNLTTLTPANRTTLSGIISPIITAVQTDIANAVIPITDANTKTVVQAALTAVQTALVAVQVALGVN